VNYIFIRLKTNPGIVIERGLKTQIATRRLTKVPNTPSMIDICDTELSVYKVLGILAEAVTAGEAPIEVARTW